MKVVPTVLSISRGVGLCKHNERAISATSIHTHMKQKGLFFKSIKNEADKNTDHWPTQRQNTFTDFSSKNVQ